ncbi:hypothetical protein [Subtercola lobariae]|uniref:Uncharacterized protein n=1 Tax=Subtercola lobariae TaxID=1588641 RepID=A0A917EVZ0_9MICO|nr:hypothetical protein [Subtercola lobariae]GGF14062.1 hypothetical protein GCM10011399_04900 [Subtercola lobariae]
MSKPRFATRLLHSDAPWYALTAGITALLTYFALGLRYAALSIPWLYNGDALSTADHFKTTLEQGWYEHNPNLGAPSGQFYNDFPVADNLHMIAAKVLGLFNGQWPIVLNMYYFIGFILAALGGYWFFRVCNMWRPLSVALAVLYALAPYHFIRGESHLFLASYYCVPLGLGILIWIMRGESVWTARTSRYRWWGVLTGRGAFTVVALALLATSSTYYGVFLIILLAFATLFVLIRDRNWRKFLGAIGVGAVTVVVMLINMAPDVIFGWTNGANPGGFFRNADDSEVYALKITQLLLPWTGNRIAFLRDFRAHYDQTFPLPSEEPALGLVAALGLIITFLVVAYMVVAWRRTRALRAESAHHVETIGYVSVLTLIAFLFSTVGGLSTLISFVTTALRGWNRMSIVIAALCLVAFGLSLQLLLTWMFKRFKLHKVVAGVTVGVISLGILGVGYYDQTPGTLGSGYAGIAATYNSDKTFFAGIQESLPAGANVLQLPYIPFPENLAANGLVGSDELIPFLQTTTVDWSAGGIKGRPKSDWPYAVSQEPGADLVKLAAGSDMSGILVDTWAYDDKGAAVVSALTAAISEAPITSADGHWVYFDIRSERAALLTQYTPEQLAAIETAVTDPIDLSLLPDFHPTSAADLTAGDSSLPSPSFSLLNDRSDSPTVTLSFTLALPATAGGTATVAFPDGQSQTVTVAPEGTVVTHRMVVSPGTSKVQVNVAGATAAAPPLVHISELTIAQQAVTEFLGQ